MVIYEWPAMKDMNGDADRARQLAGALEDLAFRVVLVARECLDMWGSPMQILPPSLVADFVCGAGVADPRLVLLSLDSPPAVAFIVSTYWYFPTRPSLVDGWSPVLRSLAPQCKIIAMVDVVRPACSFCLIPQSKSCCRPLDDRLDCTGACSWMHPRVCVCVRLCVCAFFCVHTYAYVFSRFFFVRVAASEPSECCSAASAAVGGGSPRSSACCRGVRG